jgi:hypothetical protein
MCASNKTNPSEHVERLGKRKETAEKAHPALGMMAAGEEGTEAEHDSTLPRRIATLEKSQQ